MNKQELINELKSAFTYVSNESIVLHNYFTSDEAVETYEIKVMKCEGKIALFKEIKFFVVDEGKVSETAFYIGYNPIGLIAFNSGLDAYLSSSTFPYSKYELLKVDIINEYAIVKVFIDDGSENITEGIFCIYIDNKVYVHKPYTGTITLS